MTQRPPTLLDTATKALGDAVERLDAALSQTVESAREDRVALAETRAAARDARAKLRAASAALSVAVREIEALVDPDAAHAIERPDERADAPTAERKAGDG
ncbi:MAG: hypothetical protein AAGC56_00555 [Pseudomonadota bacterium]